MREEILTTQNHFRCSELTLIGTLAHFGFPVEAFERDPKSPERIAAIFRVTEELNEVCQKFWQGQLKVEPKQFWQSIREVKARMRTEIHD